MPSCKVTDSAFLYTVVIPDSLSNRTGSHWTSHADADILTRLLSVCDLASGCLTLFGSDAHPHANESLRMTTVRDPSTYRTLFDYKESREQNITE